MLKRKLSVILLLLAMLMLLAAFAATTAMAEGTTATIWTDKTDYSPAETVIIYGSGFNPEAPVNMTVTRPDGNASEWAVTSDSSGSFTTTYLLDGITGTYTVTATDGTNTATTTFTDATQTTTTLDAISSPLAAGQTGVSFSGSVSATPAVPNGAPVELQYSDQQSFPTPSITILITVYTSGGSGSFSGTFTAPSTPGTYYFRAVFPAYGGGGGWQKSDSSGQQIVVSGFQLTVVTDPASVDSTTGSGWYLSGAVVDISAPEYRDIVAGSSRYHFTGWSGTGITDPTAYSTTVTMGSAAKTVTANYVIQYRITVTSAKDSPTASAWVNAGQDFTASVTSPVADGANHQWVCTGHNVDGGDAEAGTSHLFEDVAAAHTIVFNWQEQYYLTVNNGDHGTASGSDWYNAGVSADFSISPTTVTEGTTRYVFIAWSGDSTSSSASASITMGSAKTVTATWQTQYWVTYAANVPVTLPASEWIVSGQPATGSFASPQYNLAGDTKYVFVNDDRLGTITAPTAITATYDTYFLLTVNSAHDTPGGGGWYKSGDTTHATLTDGEVLSGDGKTKYVFTGWGDDASGTGLTSDDITMDAPKTATANWDTYFLLTVQTSGLSSASYPTNVNLDGSTVGTAYDSSAYTQWFAANDPSGTIGVDATVSGGTGTQFVFTKWSEDSSTDNPRASVTMDGPKTFTAVYNTQYQVTFKQSGSGVAPTVTYHIDSGSDVTDTVGFSVWVDSGHKITYSYEDPVSGGAGTQYVLTDTSPTSPQTVNSAFDVTGTYKTQYKQTFDSFGLGGDATGDLLAFGVSGGSHSGTSPISVSGGFIWVDADATVTYSFVDPVTSSVTGKRYRLDSVTGPDSGYTVSGANTLTGNYVTQFEVSFHQSGLDGDAGTNTVFTVGSTTYAFGDSPVDDIWVDSGTTFTWEDTVSGGSGKQFVKTGESGLTSPITESGTSTATYTAQYQVPASYSTSDGSTPSDSMVLSGTQAGDNTFTLTLTTSVQNVWLDAGTSWSVNNPIPAIPTTVRWIATSGTGGTVGSLTVVSPLYYHQFKIAVTASPGGALGGSFDVTYTQFGTTYSGVSETTPWSDWANAGTTVTVSNPQYTIPSTMYKFDHYAPSNSVSMSESRTITLVYIELPYSGAVTAGGSPFDKNSAAGQQFNLLFTRDITDVSKYQLTASNPGQFFYNVFYIGTPGATVTISLIIPSPFVTQGAVPIHVYSKVDVSSSGSFTSIDEILHVALDPGTGDTITFDVTVPDTGLVYVRIHLDFGLKKQTGYSLGKNNLADNTDDAFDLPNLSNFVFSYTYAVDGGEPQAGGSTTIQNINIFKNDPGFFGVVTIDGEPVEGATITIRDSSGKVIGTAITDENGYYFFYYKHTGKEAIFTVTLTSPAGTSSQTVSLKANKFIKVSFEL